MGAPQAPRVKATLTGFAPELAHEIQKTLTSTADLSAVERFSQWHIDAKQPALQGLYQELLPASPPSEGQQYAFSVDLDRCSGCKACVTACHSLNGLDEGESWRTAGSLLSTSSQQHTTITSSCHHCVEPGCAQGCPTLAYEKDALTGIVQHLDDQCMGCQYCMWTCPYDAPKWNAKLGIVRKCDMCQSRLAVGQAPACVQACPSQAIRITTIEVASLRDNPRLGTDLPSIVPPQHTLPTSTYTGTLADHSVAADQADLQPEHAHTPLAILLVLTQWAAGLAVLELLLSLWTGSIQTQTFAIASVFLSLGIGIGTLHLGRPLRAWKAFLGWRRSWFSREVLAFGHALPLAVAAAIPTSWYPTFVPVFTQSALAIGATALLVAGVVCSALLYMVTPRPAWARSATAVRFALTAFGGGAVILGALGGEGIRIFGVISIVTGIAKVMLVRADRKEQQATDALRQQARLLNGPLRNSTKAQGQLFVAAMISALLGTLFAQPFFFAIAIGLRLGSDLVERRLFFMACPATRMPGVSGRA